MISRISGLSSTIKMAACFIMCSILFQNVSGISAARCDSLLYGKLSGKFSKVFRQKAILYADYSIV